MLLEEMRLFDRRVYGVAHGLLMGSRDLVWAEAEGLFDEIARMDYATGAAFYNALTDVLWHFGQVGRGALFCVPKISLAFLENMRYFTNFRLG